MTSARMSALASLRGSIERIEAQSGTVSPVRAALGHGEADAMLQGGLALGAIHEVFCEGGRQSAAATGFVAGLARRVTPRRPLIWVRQDFSEREVGRLSMGGLVELGLDPRRLRRGQLQFEFANDLLRDGVLGAQQVVEQIGRAHV